MAHELKWLGYDFLIDFAHFLTLRASVSSWFIFSIQENQSQNMDTQYFALAINPVIKRSLTDTFHKHG